MIVSTRQDKPPFTVNYPKLMVGSTGDIYLMSQCMVGTMLCGPYPGISYHQLNMQNLKDYHGSITLTNGKDV